MDINMRSDNPLACNMDVFNRTERENHLQATRQLFQSVQGIHESENGYEFLFPNGSEIIMALADFITNERRCCPFLDFTLTVSENAKPVTLLLSGPEGTRKFLQAELHEAFV
jgi:hypothetical protein